MSMQITKEDFAAALSELGHDPNQYAGQRLSLSGMCELYNLDQESILDAIEMRQIAAHYDYYNDTIWVDALDAAHFYFVVRTQADLFSA